MMMLMMIILKMIKIVPIFQSPTGLAREGGCSLPSWKLWACLGLLPSGPQVKTRIKEEHERNEQKVWRDFLVVMFSSPPTSSGIQLKTQKSSVWESAGPSRPSRMPLDQRCTACFNGHWFGIGLIVCWDQEGCRCQQKNIYCFIDPSYFILMEPNWFRWSATLTQWQMLCARFPRYSYILNPK